MSVNRNLIKTFNYNFVGTKHVAYSFEGLDVSKVFGHLNPDSEYDRYDFDFKPDDSSWFMPIRNDLNIRAIYLHDEGVRFDIYLVGD